MKLNSSPGVVNHLVNLKPENAQKTGPYTKNGLDKRNRVKQEQVEKEWDIEN
jgi:hypothetical protein